MTGHVTLASLCSPGHWGGSFTISSPFRGLGSSFVGFATAPTAMRWRLSGPSVSTHRTADPAGNPNFSRASWRFSSRRRFSSNRCTFTISYAKAVRRVQPSSTAFNCVQPTG